jgi:hypothetical protein
MRLFSFPDHMLLWVPFAVIEGLRVSRAVPIDAIYTTSPPHSSHLAGLLLANFLKKPWVADFRDPWTLNAYRDDGILERIFLGIERRLERAVLKNAATVLANTAANIRNLLSAFPELSENKVVHMPNGWEEFPPEFYKIKRDDGPLTIVHAGTFYPRFKPYGLLYALAAWRDGKCPGDVPPLRNGDIRIILLGAKDEETRRIISELKISELVEVRPWVSMGEARKIMCQADLLWATLGTGKESSTYIPSKLFEYISARKPIIGIFPEGEAAALIKDTGAGMVFSADDLPPFICFLTDVLRGPIERWIPDFLGNRRMDVLSKYEIPAIAKRFSDTLNDLIGTRQGLK